MPATPFDSALYRDLFQDAEIGRLFTDTAEVRAMLIVEGALAKAQGKLGLIPEVSAAAIHRASLEAQVDPAGLAAETGISAVPVPALVKAFRAEIGSPEHAQYAHWGATSQDIVDTAMTLRLRQVLALFETRLKAAAQGLADLADAHAALPTAGRTYGQVATPISFGSMAASWGAPLLRHLERLAEIKPRLLCVSLSGAAGNLSAMGPQGPAVRAELARLLDLGDPGESWHTARDRFAEFAAWMALTAGSLAKMGEDLTLMAGAGEIRLSGSGGSSTMPQKQNPVAPSLLVALARHAAALSHVMTGGQIHRQQRDGAAWIGEWLSHAQLILTTGRALDIASTLPARITPQPDALLQAIDTGLGLTYAEALSFALADMVPRPEAQAAIKRLCAEALDSGVPLATLAARDFPDRDWTPVFSPVAQLGTAPDDARAYAARARAL